MACKLILGNVAAIDTLHLLKISPFIYSIKQSVKNSFYILF